MTKNNDNYVIDKRLNMNTLEIDKAKLYRQRYLEKRNATETPEEHEARLQKARDAWMKRWNNMTEEEREKHRKRNRERNRRISAARRLHQIPLPNISLKNESQDLKLHLFSMESNKTNSEFFVPEINYSNANEILANVCKTEINANIMEQLAASSISNNNVINFSHSLCANDQSHLSGSRHLSNCDQEFSDFNQNFVKTSQPPQNAAFLASMCNEFLEDEVLLTSKTPKIISKSCNLQSDMQLNKSNELKDESNPLGELVVNIHRKLRCNGFELNAAKFKKDVMDLIANAEFVMFEKSQQ